MCQLIRPEAPPRLGAVGEGSRRSEARVITQIVLDAARVDGYAEVVRGAAGSEEVFQVVPVAFGPRHGPEAPQRRRQPVRRVVGMCEG